MRPAGQSTVNVHNATSSMAIGKGGPANRSRFDVARTVIITHAGTYYPRNVRTPRALLTDTKSRATQQLLTRQAHEEQQEEDPDGTGHGKPKPVQPNRGISPLATARHNPIESRSMPPHEDEKPTSPVTGSLYTHWLHPGSWQPEDPPVPGRGHSPRSLAMRACLLQQKSCTFPVSSSKKTCSLQPWSWQRCMCMPTATHTANAERNKGWGD